MDLMRTAPLRLFIAALASALIICLGAPSSASARQAHAAEGRGQFAFSGWAGPPIAVWYQLPKTVRSGTPVVVVMHGVNRDADRYRDEWASLALTHDFILVVPEFREADFPGSLGYNTGFFQNADGTPRPRPLWSFTVIEPLFDEVRDRFGTQVQGYNLYGHSAGAQYVHRFVLAMPQARIEKAIAANAGWYTMPDPMIDFPYGTGGTMIAAANIEAALGKPLIVLLGTADTATDDPNLRRTREANRQGPHRYARGKNFFAAGQAVAKQLGVPFAWRQEDVVGAGHQNSLMAKAAAELISGHGDWNDFIDED